MKLNFKISKKTRLYSHILASGCFIALFIWGWDLPLAQAVSFLVIILFFLLAIMLLAAMLGFVLRILRGNSSPIDKE